MTGALISPTREKAKRKRARAWLEHARESVRRALEEIDKDGGTDVAVYTFAAIDDLNDAIKELRK